MFEHSDCLSLSRDVGAPIVPMLLLHLTVFCQTGLAGERTRWEASIVTLDAQLGALPGDVALASAFMSYAGPFPSQYRETLAKQTWQKQVGALLPTVHCLPLSQSLVDPESSS